MFIINYFKALILAWNAHDGQFDKAGKPYIYHPMRVSKGAISKDGKIVGLLHDVLEDTDYTESDMKFLSEDQQEALRLLNHEKSVDYFEYVKALKANPIAREVKLSDLADNMNLKRLNNPTEKDFERLEKYKKAREILLENE